MESVELHDRPTCSECTPELQEMRGCKKPGMNLERKLGPVKSTSPLLMLNPGDRELNECPTGYILRECPWIWDVIEYCGLVENMTPEQLEQTPRYFRHMFRLWGSEKDRIREAKRFKRKIEEDSKRGMRIRQRR